MLGEIKAKEDAKKAEEKVLFDIQIAKEKAEREKQDALESVRREQEKKDQLEQDRIEKERLADEARQADLEHRKKINNAILGKFADFGMNESKSKDLIIRIAKGMIPNLSINY